MTAPVVHESYVPVRPLTFGAGAMDRLRQGNLIRTIVPVTPQPKEESYPGFSPRFTWAPRPDNPAIGYHEFLWNRIDEAGGSLCRWHDKGDYYGRGEQCDTRTLDQYCPFGPKGFTNWVRVPHWRRGQWVKDGRESRWVGDVPKYGETYSSLDYVTTEDPKNQERWRAMPAPSMPLWACVHRVVIMEVLIVRFHAIPLGWWLNTDIPALSRLNNWCLSKEDRYEILETSREYWNARYGRALMGVDTDPWVWAVRFLYQPGTGFRSFDREFSQRRKGGLWWKGDVIPKP